MRPYTILFVLLCFPILLRAQDAEVIRLSEPVLSTAAYEEFGSELGEFEHSFNLVEATDRIADFEGKEFVLTSEVSKVCQVKGCWMILSEADRSARVRFKDYEFFVPTDITGRRVEARGFLSEVELSEEEAKHFAEDAEAGSSDTVTGPQREYNFTATSVRVYR